MRRILRGLVTFTPVAKNFVVLLLRDSRDSITRPFACQANILYQLSAPTLGIENKILLKNLNRSLNNTIPFEYIFYILQTTLLKGRCHFAARRSIRISSISTINIRVPAMFNKFNDTTYVLSTPPPIPLQNKYNQKNYKYTRQDLIAF